jgi:ACR3 family arsenite efflux pump ArsB
LSILSKLQPIFIILSAFAGILLGRADTAKFIELFLIVMLFFVFLDIDIKEIKFSFSNLKFSITALIINFVWTPLFAFFLAKTLDSSDLQIGFIMMLVTPCTDWYIIFTGLAGGNVPLGASILPFNLVLQIVLLPVYVYLFLGESVSFDVFVILQSILFVLIIPLLLSIVAKIIFSKIKCGLGVVEKIKKHSGDIQMLFLCLAIIAMFSSQSTLMLDNLYLFWTLLLPLIIFFIVNFILALCIGKILKLAFKDTTALIFTTSARNSPIALAIATITFPLQPIISLVLVVCPLVELPLLAVNSAILKRFNKPK